MKLVIAILLALAATSLAENCGEQLKGARECMKAKMTEKKDARKERHEARKAEIQKCFDLDPDCAIPAPPGNPDRDAKRECMRELKDELKPKMLECARENEHLADFEMPERPVWPEPDALDKLMFGLCHRMRGRGGRGGRGGGRFGGRRGRGGRAQPQEGETPKRGPAKMMELLEECEPEVGECLKELHQGWREARGDGPDFREMKAKMQEKKAEMQAAKEECFKDVSDTCEELDVREIMCKCGRELIEEEEE
eukprot:950830_1